MSHPLCGAVCASASPRAACLPVGRFFAGRSLAAMAAAICLLVTSHATAQETAGAPESEAEVSLEPTVLEVEATDDATASELDAAVLEQVRARQDIVSIHKAFGVATWISMAATAALGFIQFADEYGFHGSESETACANNDAVFQDFCTGTPWAHAIAGFTTTALYLTTAGISFAVPAPLETTADLELHKTLRWFHFATMLATAAFGLVTANIDADFETRQILAGVHQGLGVATFGLLTAAAGVVIF